MRLRNYSNKTIKSYKSGVRLLADHFRPRHPRELSSEELRSFLLHQIERRHLAAATISQLINAMRFLYVELYKKPFALGNLRRPRKEKKLPVVLSGEEVQGLFESLGNLKHRTMMMLVYSAGLRVGELVKLRPEDIDGKRKMIHIHGGKGKKDRYTVLSDFVLEALREYWKTYHPAKYLFEGQEPEKPYSPRSAQQVFENAKEKAHIKKDVSIHSLRHAFATHLLEQGTDIRFIQELLGHASVKTTEIYTHVSTRTIAQIKSPIDSLMRPRKA